jgi:hypothetical protein
VQRGEHEIEHEITFANHDGYVFHDSRGFECGEENELQIVQDFVRRRSRETILNERLHAIWFVPFGDCDYNFTGFAFQVLCSDGQQSANVRFGSLRQDLPG